MVAGGGVVLYSCPVLGISWQMAATCRRSESDLRNQGNQGVVLCGKHSPTLMV